MSRRPSAAVMATLLALSAACGGGIVTGPMSAPVPAGSGIPPRTFTAELRQRVAWLTHGQNPKRRSLAERKQRRAKRRQRSR